MRVGRENRGSDGRFGNLYPRNSNEHVIARRFRECKLSESGVLLVAYCGTPLYYSLLQSSGISIPIFHKFSR